MATTTDLEKPPHPRPAASASHPVFLGFADPAALGLGAFGLSTFVLSVGNTGLIPGAVAAVLGLGLFYGGISQVLAGLWEFAQANTFGAVAFVSYGAFWLAYWWLVTNEKVAAEAGGAGIGVFLAAWGVFTLYMVFAAIRINRVLFVLFIVATFTFAALSAGAFSGEDVITRIGGWLGICTALTAWYGSFASVMNATWKRSIIPVGEARER